MKTSFIITAHNKPELEQALRKNQHLWQSGDNQLILVCGNDHKKYNSLLEELGAIDFKVIELIADTFNKSKAINIGVQFAAFEVLFLLDADIILREFPFEENFDPASQFQTVKKIVETSGTTLPQDGYISEIRNSKTFVTTDGKELEVPISVAFPLEGARSGIGLCRVKKEHFLKINGMNGGLENWGWEDCDLFVRLQYLGLVHVAAGQAHHISHEVRQSNSDMMNFRKCLSNYFNKRFYGTYSEDIKQTETYKTHVN